MKYIITVFVLIAFASNVTAQTKPGSIGSNDPDAKKVLDAVSAKFKTFKTVKGNFSLEVKNGSGKTQGTKKGVVYMKGNKYRVSITGQEIFCDGKNIWTFDKSANEVQVSGFDATGSMITPQKLFTNFYDKDFLYKLNDDKKVGAKVYQEVELTPIDKSKPFFKVLLGVDKSTKVISSTQIFEKNGNKYTYAMSNIATNTAITDDTFVFDVKKYPGVEVVDLR